MRATMWTTNPSLCILFLLSLLQVVPDTTAARPCIPKFLGANAMVCVCNATYCDTLDPIAWPPMGHYLKYESSRAGKRLELSKGKLKPNSSGSRLQYTYNPFVQYQPIKGFGGSHTDAAAINIMSLSPGAQDHLLRSYFAEDGIEYNLLRLPMGCSDFSTHPYSYDDNCQDDWELKCFSLAPEDTDLRIPLLHRIMALSKRPLSLVASLWTAPSWLRTNNKVVGKARMKGEAGDRYHKTWAHYFIRFLDEYASHNITFWAITAQNEPGSSVYISFEEFPTTRFSAEEQRDFIIKDLGPALTSSPHRDVLLIVLDDLRCYLPKWANVVIGNSSAAQYVSGIGLHWYMDPVTPPGPTLEATYRLYPNYFLLYTESCNGFLAFEKKVDLGNWNRGTSYSSSILTNLNSFVTGWIDWNMALDMVGGPNWVGNFVDSPIIVNPHKDEFYKQPMFYHLAHFSKFIPEGSVRVSLTSNSLFSSCQLQTAGFLRPDGIAVVVVLNRCFLNVAFSILDQRFGYIEDVARAYSIQTYLWETRI